ncbi:manganese efflux pump, partial [Escherichia coli]
PPTPPPPPQMRIEVLWARRWGEETGLDAMAVGVGLAFLQVNIIATALAIGCATLIMSTLGMMVGRFIGSIIGKKAEILGGLVLIGIGVQILWTHFHG